MTEKAMFADAKVGDRIWSVRSGWCTVEHINRSVRHPISVCTDSDSYESLTLDGKYDPRDKYPSFFWDEIKFEIPPRPKRKVKKTMVFWINVYPQPNIFSSGHKTEEDAKNNAGAFCIGQHQVIFEYEEEEK